MGSPKHTFERPCFFGNDETGNSIIEDCNNIMSSEYCDVDRFSCGLKKAGFSWETCRYGKLHEEFKNYRKIV